MQHPCFHEFNSPTLQCTACNFGLMCALHVNVHAHCNPAGLNVRGNTSALLGSGVPHVFGLDCESTSALLGSGAPKYMVC